MTVNELRDMLDYAASNGMGDAEVRVLDTEFGLMSITGVTVDEGVNAVSLDTEYRSPR